MPAAAPLEPSRDEARALAARELSGREYQEQDNWVLALWEAVQDWLEGITVPGLGTSWSGPVLIALVLLVLTAVVLLVAGPLHRTATRQEELAVFTDGVLTAEEHRRRAEEHAAAGRFGPASTERFRALVRSAEERALLARRPGRTAAEAGWEISTWFPAAADRLRAAARTFDDVRYGGRPADAGTYTAVAALEDEVRTGRPGAPAAGGDGAGAGTPAGTGAR
ncbi:DUF4129 domain-containing protein [Kineococcus sp. NUM-3379]